MHFPLHPETPPEGVALAELFAGRGIDLDAMHEQMQARMTAEGLPYNRRSHTYNSRLAQELGKWADEQTGGGAIHHALFTAYFVDTRNIGEPEVLLDIAQSVGLSRTAAQDVLEQRTFRQAVDEDWARSGRYGITGVPTFVAGGYAVVGAQPYATLAALVSEVAGGAGQ